MQSIDQSVTTRHEFRLTIGRKIGQSIFATVFLIGAGSFVTLAMNPFGREFAVAVGVLALVLWIMLLVQVWSSRLILDGNRIGVHSAFRTHSASRAEIEGLRKIKNQYGSWTRFYLKGDMGAFSISDSSHG